MLWRSECPTLTNCEEYKVKRARLIRRASNFMTYKYLENARMVSYPASGNMHRPLWSTTCVRKDGTNYARANVGRYQSAMMQRVDCCVAPTVD